MPLYRDDAEVSADLPAEQEPAQQSAAIPSAIPTRKSAPATRAPARGNYDDLIDFAAEDNGLDPNFVRAIIGQESGGNRNAVSNKGAGGLMQLMPATAARFGVKDRFDPAENIRGGTAYLKFLSDKFDGNLELVAAAYNAGEGAVMKHGGIPPYKETQNYVPSVMSRYAKLQGQGGAKQGLHPGLVQPGEWEDLGNGAEAKQSGDITWGDRGRALMSGFANVPTTVGTGLEMLGQKTGFEPLESIGNTMRETGKEAEDWWTEGMTDAGRNPQDLWGKISQSSLQSLPGVVAMAIPSMGAASLLTRLGFGAAGAGAASSSAVEGLFSALQNASQTGDEVRDPQRTTQEQLESHPGYIQALELSDYDQDAARELLARSAEAKVFKTTLPWTAATSALTGGGVLGAIAGRTAGAASPGFLKSVGGTMVKESGQEALQSAGEQGLQNLAAQQVYDQGRDLLSGVGEAAVVGGGAGGLLGGIGGGVAHIGGSGVTPPPAPGAIQQAQAPVAPAAQAPEAQAVPQWTTPGQVQPQIGEGYAPAAAISIPKQPGAYVGESDLLAPKQPAPMATPQWTTPGQVQSQIGEGYTPPATEFSPPVAAQPAVEEMQNATVTPRSVGIDAGAVAEGTGELGRGEQPSVRLGGGNGGGINGGGIDGNGPARADVVGEGSNPPGNQPGAALKGSNGFIPAPDGRQVRIEQHSAGSNFLDPTADIGAFTYTVRSANSDVAPLYLVLDKNGKLVMVHRAVDASNKSTGVAWTPENSDQAEEVRALLEQRAGTKLGSPERKAVDAKLEETVKGYTNNEAPKAEAPKAEAPKAEAPKAEAPKAEAPKAEAPKAEGRKYHVVAINEKTGKKSYLSREEEPMSHSEAVTMLKKQSQHPDVRKQLEEAKTPKAKSQKASPTLQAIPENKREALALRAKSMPKDKFIGWATGFVGRENFGADRIKTLEAIHDEINQPTTEETQNAQQIPSAKETDASGSAQPGIREEGGRTAEGSEGVRGSGQEESQEGKKQIGDAQRVMGTDAILADIKSDNGVDYELYNANRLKDKSAFVRVYDRDSGNVVSLTKYPTFDEAEAAFKEATKLIPTEEPPTDEPPKGKKRFPKKEKVNDKRKAEGKPPAQMTAGEKPTLEDKGALQDAGETGLAPQASAGVQKAVELVERLAKSLGIDAPHVMEDASIDGRGQYIPSALKQNRVIKLHPTVVANLESSNDLTALAAAEVVYHEFGHHVAETQLEASDEATQMAVEQDYANWLLEQRENATPDILASRQTPMRAGVSERTTETQAEAMGITKEYALSKQEWLADQAARYLLHRDMQGVKAAETKSLVRRIAEKLRALYDRFKARLEVAPSMREFMDGLIASHEEKIATGREGAPLSELGKNAEKQTATPEFKAWFKNSKVVDANGEPKIVYHGSYANFDTFKAGKGAHLGYHFGDVEAANTRLEDTAAGKVAEEDIRHYGNKASDLLVKAANLQAKLNAKGAEIEPAEMEAALASDDVNKALAELFKSKEYVPTAAEQAEIDALKAEAAKFTLPIYPFGVGGNIGAYYLSAQKLLRLPDVGNWGSPVAVRNALPWASEARTLQQVKEELKSHGYDGIVYANAVENPVMKTDSYIVFEPNQIKSATGNSGAFSTESNNTLEDLGAIMNPAAVQEAVSNWVSDTFTQPGTFSFLDKTISTQLNKALKNPEFGKFWRRVHQMYQDVNRATARPADLAPTILQKFDISNWKEAVKTLAGRAKATAADMELVHDVLMTGTLHGGPSPLTGKVFTPGELQGEIELLDGRKVMLTEQQRKLYMEARAAVDASLSEAAAAQAWALARQHVANDSLRDWVSENPLDAQRAIEDAMDLRAEEAQDEIDVLKANGLRKNAEGTSVKTLQNRLDELKADQVRIQQVFKKADDLIGAGYMPAHRFGQYRVVVMNDAPAKGEDPIEYVEQFESVREANAARRKLMQEFSEEDGYSVSDVQEMNPEKWKLYRGVNPETVMLFAKEAGIPTDDVMQEWYKEAVSNRSVLSRLAHRKGYAGYSRDLPRSLATFVTSNGKFTGQTYHMADLERTVAETREGGLQAEEQKLLETVKGDTGGQDFASQARSVMASWYILGSAASAVVNLTQPLTQTASWLYGNGSGSLAGTAKLLGNAYSDVSKGNFDNELKAAIARAETDGTISASEVYHLYQESMKPWLARLGGGEIARKTQTLMFLWGAPFSMAEQYNRKVSFVAAYRLAKQKGLAADEAFRFAEQGINETQGIYALHNRPNWARSGFGSLAFTFRQYTIGYLEQLNRLARSGPEGKRAAGLQLAVLFLFGGLLGAPGEEDVEDAIDTVMQSVFGKAFVSRVEIRKALEKHLGKELAGFVQHGISEFLPFDVSGRMSMGNLIPGTAALKPSEKQPMRDIGQFFGPVGSTVNNTIDAARMLLGEGDVLRAMRIAAPTAIGNVIKGVEMATTGEARTNYGGKLVDASKLDALFQAIGFQPAGKAEESRLRYPLQELMGLRSKVEGDIAERLSRGIADHDYDSVAKARRKLAEWNRKNPSLRVELTPEQIKKRVKNLRKSASSKLQQSTAPEARGFLRKELEEK